MLHPMEKKDNNPFLLRPPRPLVNRLRALAARFGMESGNQLAIAVITDYLDSWVEVEQARRDALAAQKERFGKIKEEMLRHPLHKATTEPVTTPLAKRKTK